FRASSQSCAEPARCLVHVITNCLDFLYWSMSGKGQSRRVATSLTGPLVRSSSDFGRLECPFRRSFRANRESRPEDHLDANEPLAFSIHTRKLGEPFDVAVTRGRTHAPVEVGLRRSSRVFAWPRTYREAV